MKELRNRLISEGYIFTHFARTFDNQKKIIGEMYKKGDQVAILRNNKSVKYFN